MPEAPIAERHMGNALPMPPARTLLRVKRQFSPGEYAVISRGFVSRNMDDKWFIYAEGDIVYFHRSWTGFCIFQVRIYPRNDGSVAITEAWVNRDTEQYNSHDDAYDAEFLICLIDCLLLGRDVDMPLPSPVKSRQSFAFRIGLAAGMLLGKLRR